MSVALGSKAGSFNGRRKKRKVINAMNYVLSPVSERVPDVHVFLRRRYLSNAFDSEILLASREASQRLNHETFGF